MANCPMVKKNRARIISIVTYENQILYNFSIELEPNAVMFGSKSIGKWRLQSLVSVSFAAVGGRSMHTTLMYNVMYIYVYVTANLRNQLFSGIPKTLRESGESLKCIEIPRNL